MPPKLPKDTRPCGLVRVSSEEQVDQFSLPMQTSKISDYCQEHLGVTLPERALFREEGVSGRPGSLKRRPGLQAALEACLAGTYTHLIVHKLDRLGRNVGLVSSVLEQLDQAGIVFISVQDRVDASTAAGRLYIAIFIAIAQWYSDNLSEETKKGKEGRKREGLYNGILPFGAMRGEGSHAVPLADLRPLQLVGADGTMRELTKHAGLLQAFEWCALGHSAREIAVKLNALGYRTEGSWGSNPFSKDTVQRLLGNRFYLGELPDGHGGWLNGKHEPLITQELWDQAQAVRVRLRKNPQTIPGQARVHILGGGLLRCGVCWAQGRSSALHVAKSRKDTDEAYFACYGRFQGHSCTQPSIAHHVLEAQVTRFFDSFILPEDYQERLLDVYREEEQHNAGTAEGPDPVARRAQLEARLERQQQLYELGDWSRERYLEARKAVLGELAELEAEHPTNAPHSPESLGRLAAYVRELKGAWHDADKTHRRLLVRTLFEQLWVIGDRIVAAKPVAQFAPFFRLFRSVLDEANASLVFLTPRSLMLKEQEQAAMGLLSHTNTHDSRESWAAVTDLRLVQTGGPDGHGFHLYHMAP